MKSSVLKAATLKLVTLAILGYFFSRVYTSFAKLLERRIGSAQVRFNYSIKKLCPKD